MGYKNNVKQITPGKSFSWGLLGRKLECELSEVAYIVRSQMYLHQPITACLVSANRKEV